MRGLVNITVHSTNGLLTNNFGEVQCLNESDVSVFMVPAFFGVGGV